MVGTHVHANRVGTNEYARMSKDRTFMVGTHVQQFQLNFYGWHLCMQTGLAPMCNRNNFYGWHQCADRHPCAFDEDSFMASLKLEQ